MLPQHLKKGLLFDTNHLGYCYEEELISEEEMLMDMLHLTTSDEENSRRVEWVPVQLPHKEADLAENQGREPEEDRVVELDDMLGRVSLKDNPRGAVGTLYWTPCGRARGGRDPRKAPIKRENW